ncbi:MAG: hypothetical protein VYE67_08965, partial [Planctomycetota bacterium]|nr:hypothetical protein [Planctomycetota bacterium]
SLCIVSDPFSRIHIKGCWLSRINKRDPLINITGSVVRTGFEPNAAFELVAQSVYAQMQCCGRRR